MPALTTEDWIVASALNVDTTAKNWSWRPISTTS